MTIYRVLGENVLSQTFCILFWFDNLVELCYIAIYQHWFLVVNCRVPWGKLRRFAYSTLRWFYNSIPCWNSYFWSFLHSDISTQNIIETFSFLIQCFMLIREKFFSVVKDQRKSTKIGLKWLQKHKDYFFPCHDWFEISN